MEIIRGIGWGCHCMEGQVPTVFRLESFGIFHGSLTVSFQIHFAELQYAQGFKPSFFVKFNAFLCSVCSVIVL